MRVALYVHCYFPEHFFGTEAYTRSVARELQALGHEVVVVAATFPGEPRQEALIERYEHDGIPVIRIDRNVHPNTSLRDTYDLPSLRAVHERILRSVRPDVVHVCHLINHTAALLDVCRALAVPVYATLTDFFGFCFTNKLQAANGDPCEGPNPARSNCIECFLVARNRNDWAKRLSARPPWRPIVAASLAKKPSLAGRGQRDIAALIARPDHLRPYYRTLRAAIAPSRYLKGAYERNGFERPLAISHFGIEIDRSAKPAREGAALRFAYIGQLADHKGVHLLIEAFRQLAPGKASLDIWGDESQDRTYAARLRALAEGGQVAFRGTFAVAEAARVLAGIDVLAIPSTWFENSPLILLQALATHTPVIVSDVEGMTEFVEPGVSGFWFPSGDAGALAAIMRRFTDDSGLAERMSATTAYARTTRKMVEDITELYDADRAERASPLPARGERASSTLSSTKRGGSRG